jgi:formate hydrogenlyase subunit 4
MESRLWYLWLVHTAAQLGMLLLLPPFFAGLVLRLKAIAAGRKGPPLLQPYYDMARLIRKGAVYSTGTSSVFRLGPVFVVSSLILAGLLMPLGGMPAPIHFSGDLIVFAYVLAISRLAIVLAALDTGSAFEGMGASREITFASLAEPIMFLILISLGLLGHADPNKFSTEWSMTGALAQMDLITWVHYGPALLPLSFALFVLILLETARVPFDDPTTHLELTMIHEVMILDHSGPDLALMEYGASMKLMLFTMLLGRILVPHHFDNTLLNIAVAILKSALLCGGIVMVEVGMARMRMKQIPGVLLAALVLAALSVVVMLVELGEFQGLPT